MSLGNENVSLEEKEECYIEQGTVKIPQYCELDWLNFKLKYLILFLRFRSSQAALSHYVPVKPEGGFLILCFIDSEFYQNLRLVFENPGELCVDVLGDQSNGGSRSWNYVLTFIIFIY